MAWPTPRLPRRNRARTRCASRGRWRRGGSCAFARFVQTHPLSRGFHAGIEKEFVPMGEPDIPNAAFPLAGGLCGIYGQRLGARGGARLHCRTRRAPSEKNLSGGIDRISSQKRRGIRRAISGLTWIWLAPRRGADFLTHGFRWCRSLTRPQPPATSCHASGMRSH